MQSTSGFFADRFRVRAAIEKGGFGGDKDDRLAALRHLIAKAERPALDGALEHVPLGIAGIDGHLAGAGLACGALHEIAARAHGDKPAAFGFFVALGNLALKARRGPVIFVASRRCLREFGAPYGHGLRQLGLDVARLVLVESTSTAGTLWALEETLRSQAAPALVLGTVEGPLDLTKTRRLSLAAASSRVPLLLLRTPETDEASAAMTRWRIASAPGPHERSDAFFYPRWNVALERCRNGRTGQWLLEWDHVAHRFRMAQIVADRPSGLGRGERSLRLAG